MTVAAAREEKVIMNIIILSGGSGKRLWPLTNEQRSKQFIRCLKREDGERESMLQRVYRQIREIYPEERITIAANRAQTDVIKEQIGDAVDISAEPCGRDTFAAIALAAAYLHDERGVGRDEVAVVCPSDFYGDPTFFLLLDNLENEVRSGRCDLALIGKNPETVNTEYGYILPAGSEAISDVRAFVEKPDGSRAKEIIGRGALWNCGVFAFRIGFVLDKMQEIAGHSAYSEIIGGFEALPKISFDNAVVEKLFEGNDGRNRIRVVRYAGAWRDIGTWGAFTEIMDEPVQGNVVVSEDCENVSVINELDLPVMVLGVENIVVTATEEGILVAMKDKSDNIKEYKRKLLLERDKL